MAIEHPILAGHRLRLYLLVWLPLAGLLAAFLIVSRPTAWVEAILLAVPLTLLYAFVCLGAWYPSRINPPGETPVRRLAVIHLVGAGVSAGLWVMVGSWWSMALAAADRLQEARSLYHDNLPLIAVAGLLLYLLAVVFYYLLLALETTHAAERQALELSVTAREAELKALRAQLDPHFLFNSLNSVSALCGRDAKAARQMSEQLGDFLRSNLELSTKELIELGRELQLAVNYLRIERVRFGERLRFVHQADEAAIKARVPPLLLQPLVENAVKHGISQLVDGGEIRINAGRQRDTLYVTVENPCDPERSQKPGAHLGLENVRRRLAAHYGERALMRIDERPERFKVELRIPLRDGPGTAEENG